MAISINLEHILAYPWLPGRAGETILLLMCTLLTGAFALVPGQRTEVLGVELLLLALRGAELVGSCAGPPRRSVGIRTLTIAAVPPLAVAGISLIAGVGGGLYWVVPAVILQLAVAVTNAWVLLVEIVP